MFTITFCLGYGSRGGLEPDMSAAPGHFPQPQNNRGRVPRHQTVGGYTVRVLAGGEYCFTRI